MKFMINDKVKNFNNQTSAIIKLEELYVNQKVN